MLKKTVFCGLGSVSAFLAGTLILGLWNVIFPYVFEFLEENFTIDNHIAQPSNVKHLLLIISVMFLVIGSLLLAKIWWRHPPWIDSMIGGNQASFWCGLGAIVSAVLPISILQQNEGIGESMTALLLIGSGSVAAYLTAKDRGNDRWLVLGVAVVFIFLGLEEISYGQTFFQWQTPEAYAVLNDQGETNLHNLDNQLLIQLNFLAALACSVFLVVGNIIGLSLGRFARFVHLPQFIGFIPFLLICLAHNPGGELLERLGAVMAVFFVFHLWRTRSVLFH
jgi:hypothetical protein